MTLKCSCQFNDDLYTIPQGNCYSNMKNILRKSCKRANTVFFLAQNLWVIISCRQVGILYFKMIHSKAKKLVWSFVRKKANIYKNKNIGYLWLEIKWKGQVCTNYFHVKLHVDGDVTLKLKLLKMSSFQLRSLYQVPFARSLCLFIIVFFFLKSSLFHLYFVLVLCIQNGDFLLLCQPSCSWDF